MKADLRNGMVGRLLAYIHHRVSIGLHVSRTRLAACLRTLDQLHNDVRYPRQALVDIRKKLCKTPWMTP